MATEQSWDDGVIWGPPCQCGGQSPPHRHGASTNTNTTWVATVSVVNADSPEDQLRDIADAYQAWKEWMMAGQRDETFEPAQPPEPSVFVLLDELIEEDNDE